jgi:hypothetical protein
VGAVEETGYEAIADTVGAGYFPERSPEAVPEGVALAATRDESEVPARIA